MLYEDIFFSIFVLEAEKFFTMEKNNLKQKAEEIIKRHVAWTLAVSAIPLPFVDVIGATAIQMDMIRQMSKLYGFDYDANKGKTLITSLITTTLAGSLAATTRTLPEVGRAASWLTTIMLQAAATYAIGVVFMSNFEQGVALIDFNLDKAGDLFEEAFEKGKEYAQNLIS